MNNQDLIELIKRDHAFYESLWKDDSAVVRMSSNQYCVSILGRPHLVARESSIGPFGMPEYVFHILPFFDNVDLACSIRYEKISGYVCLTSFRKGKDLKGPEWLPVQYLGEVCYGSEVNFEFLKSLERQINATGYTEQSLAWYGVSKTVQACRDILYPKGTSKPTTDRFPIFVG